MMEELSASFFVGGVWSLSSVIKDFKLLLLSLFSDCSLRTLAKALPKSELSEIEV